MSHTKRGELVNSKLSRVMLVISAYFLTGALLSFGRYFALSKNSRANCFLIAAAHMNVEWYSNMLGMNSGLFELFLTDNQRTIGHLTTLDFFRQRRKRFELNATTQMEKLYREDHGETSKIFRVWADTSMREAYRKTDEHSEYFVGDLQAMAGIVNSSVLEFGKKYVILADQLVQEWRLAGSRSEKLDLLKKDQYSSMVAYAMYNSLGTGDAVYYHVVYPLWTYLSFQLEQVPAFINLANILSYSYSLVLFLFALFFIIVPFIRLSRERDEVVFCVPVRLMEENYHWKAALKTARENTKFAFL